MLSSWPMPKFYMALSTLPDYENPNAPAKRAEDLFIHPIPITVVILCVTILIMVLMPASSQSTSSSHMCVQGLNIRKSSLKKDAHRPSTCCMSSVIISPLGQLLRMHLAADWRRQQRGLCNPGYTVKSLLVISVLAHHCWRSCCVFLSSFYRHQSSEVARCCFFVSILDCSVYIWCFITRDF